MQQMGGIIWYMLPRWSRQARLPRQDDNLPGLCGNRVAQSLASGCVRQFLHSQLILLSQKVAAAGGFGPIADLLAC